MAIPCKNCLILPVCREKEYTDLMYHCKIIRNFFYYEERYDLHATSRKGNFRKDIYELREILKAEKWEITKSDNGLIHVRPIDAEVA